MLPHVAQYPLVGGAFHDESKKNIKDQESIQSSTTPVPEYQMGK